MSAQVGSHNGTPTLFLDGQPAFAGYMWTSVPDLEDYPAADIVRRFSEAGVHLYAFDVGTQSSKEWCGPGPGRDSPFDFSLTEARLRRMIDVDPAARFHFRVHLDQYDAWWRETYPEECELGSNGTRASASFASVVWRDQAMAFLRAYIGHLESVGLADRVVAYQTGAGGTGEWVKGECSMASECGDYSQPMRRYFQSWLHGRYGGEVSALRKAWNNPNLTFETAGVPTATSQLTTTHFLFRDPRQEQAVIDYYTALAELCADLLIDFHRTVKEASGGTALAGAFYGYLLELAWNSAFFGGGTESEYSTTQRCGHLGLGKVLRSPYTDFIVSPYSYGFRGIGGHGCSMPPSESMRLHGKLYLFEEDSRTHLNPHDGNYGGVTTLSDSIAVLKRNFAEVLTRGQGIWWLGNPPPHPHLDPNVEPAFRPLLKQFQEIGNFGLHLNLKPSAEIAVLLDDESFFYETVRNDIDLPLIFQQRLWGLPRLGAPADYYLLQDLLEGRLPPYKLYIFLNPFRLDQSRRQALAREIQRDGRVALWLYAPGYIKDEPSLDNMTEVTGFQFGMGENPWGPMIHITDFTHPITERLPQDIQWGTNNRLGPVFHLEDSEARVLGEVVYSVGRGRPGIGVKTFPEWTSVYVAAPNIPAPVLRGLAHFAGVHLYSDAGDALYVAPQLLGVHTVSGGQRTFNLPRTVEVVFDLFEHRWIAHHTHGFTVTLPPRSTTLYYTGDAETLKKVVRGA